MKKLHIALTVLLVSSSITHAGTRAFIWNAATGMKDLGTLGGPNSYATGINNNGQVCGNADLPDGTSHPFIWTEASGMVDLGEPAGDTFIALGINSRGHVVGSNTGSAFATVSYVWGPRSGFISIPIRPGYTNGAAGINDLDEVTGTGYGPGFLTNAFIWKPGWRHPHYLGTYPGGSLTRGTAVNNLEHVVAWGDFGNSAQDRGDNLPYFVVLQYDRATGWKDKGGINFATIPTGNNDTDDIVGYTMDTFALDTAVYFPPFGGVTILPPPNGYSEAHALAVNESSEIVGYCFYPGSVTRAVFWSAPGFGGQDIGTLPGGTYASANALNDLGQVVGSSEVP